MIMRGWSQSLYLFLLLFSLGISFPIRASFTESSDMSKETWSKKKGLDLRWDKRTILITEIKEKGRASKDIPKVNSDQVEKLGATFY